MCFFLGIFNHYHLFLGQSGKHGNFVLFLISHVPFCLMMPLSVLDFLHSLYLAARSACEESLPILCFNISFLTQRTENSEPYVTKSLMSFFFSFAPLTLPLAMYHDRKFIFTVLC